MSDNENNKINFINKNNKNNKINEINENNKINFINENNKINENKNKKILTEEDIFLNLKILSYVNVNEKIKSNDKNIIIDNRFFQSVIRWFTHDDRTKTIENIEKIIKRGIELINNRVRIIIHTNSLIEQKDNIEVLERYMQHFTSSIPGLDNLKVTYQGDSAIQSKLDLLIDKIRYSIEKIKLLILKKNFSKK
jgi:hypothetical protein